METRKQDPDAIAEEAVGQRHGEPPPYAVNQKAEMSQEEVARRLSEPAGGLGHQVRPQEGVLWAARAGDRRRSRVSLAIS